MALGTWKIYVPRAAAYATLDLTNGEHLGLLRSSSFTLLDDGLSGTTLQSTATIPVAGLEYRANFFVADVATYTAGTIRGCLTDPSDTVNDVLGLLDDGVTHKAATIAPSASSGGGVWDGIPAGSKFVASSLAGAGSGRLIVRVSRA